jgi:PHP family Zn ribbon phosphoesterase
MTKELIENIRAIIVPYMAHDLRRINYEKMGEIDAEQFSEDMNEILDLAAKTLEQQPCEDAISRQAAIDALDKRFDEIPMEQTTEILLLRKDLRTLPPVQPKIKVGHWIDVMVGDMPAQACDQCKTFYPLSYTGGGHRFCPNCGAKMIEPQESEG